MTKSRDPTEELLTCSANLVHSQCYFCPSPGTLC